MLLGKWVARQRYAYLNPDRSSARVTPERKALLDKLGMVWEKYDPGRSAMIWLWPTRQSTAIWRSLCLQDRGRRLAGQLGQPPAASPELRQQRPEQ